jgi:hypothetical protein
MKTNRFTLIFVSFVLLVMLGGCGTLQVAPIPTNTPAPTMTPEPALKCDISNDSANGNLNVGFDIVTESVSEASPLVTTYNNEEQDLRTIPPVKYLCLRYILTATFYIKAAVTPIILRV